MRPYGKDGAATPRMDTHSAQVRRTQRPGGSPIVPRGRGLTAPVRGPTATSSPFEMFDTVLYPELSEHMASRSDHVVYFQQIRSWTHRFTNTHVGQYNAQNNF